MKEVYKKCTECSKPKTLDEFHNSSISKDGKRPQCKSCSNARAKKSHHKNKKIRNEYSRKYHEINREKEKLYYLKNKQKILARQKAKWHSEKSEKTKERREKRNARNKIARADHVVRFANGIGNAVRQSFSRNGYTKNNRLTEILGCDFSFFKSHIENQFLHGMAFDNYGMWHIDHIIPIATAKNIEDIIRLNHYSNLQPLWKSDNLEKRDKILDKYILDSNIAKPKNETLVMPCPVCGVSHTVSMINKGMSMTFKCKIKYSPEGCKSIITISTK